MKGQPANFGVVTIPVTKHHQQTGSYTSLDYNEVRVYAIIEFHPPSLDNPLYEEAASKTYLFEAPKSRQLGKR